MKMVGDVELPQSAFLAVLKTKDEWLLLDCLRRTAGSETTTFR
jgi:hypothetical protein